ncbi:hypothetical protein [Streptacidiphilus sp. EB103A]|uniref:hypothetical protein n=1 Tax=Streptacidiphilus sp. EB103A TaxID=3156275 RepID=UPI003513CCB2
MPSETPRTQQPAHPHPPRRTASMITDDELDLLYAELDQYRHLLRVIGLPPGVVPAEEGDKPVM